MILYCIILYSMDYIFCVLILSNYTFYFQTEKLRPNVWKENMLYIAKVGHFYNFCVCVNAMFTIQLCIVLMKQSYQSFLV